MLPLEQIGLSGLRAGASFEFLDDLKTRQMSHPIHPLCRACASNCKVHDAPGLIVFVCHAHRRLKKRT
jgi:hypothetical protein